MGYEIIRRIGRGGMGVVDLAHDDDGHEVALKRLALHGTPDELARARLRVRREVEVLRQLDHPAIVRLLDVVDDGDDVVLVMDHLAGGNLAQRVEASGPLPPAEVRTIADRLLDALAAAHRLGVVHRDIKPSNVLFDADGRAALADFGAATHRDATPGLTVAEGVLGTPGFMAPEQARGDDVTAAADVFSLGATLLFALTGEGPYGTADPRALLLRAATGRTEKLPRDLPVDLRQRLEAMLDPDPSRRPTAAALFGGAEGPGGTRLLGAARTAPRRRRARLAAGAAIAVLGLGAAAAVLSGGDGNGGRLAPPDGPAAPATSTTEACVDLPYQPCGEDPAPNTDGRRCLAGFADYDDDPATGCEAEPDGNPDRLVLDDGDEATGNLVPEDDVDELLLPVEDRPQLLGDGALHVTLTAPAGVSQRLTVWHLDEDGEPTDELGTVVSSDGEPATVTIGDPGFARDDGTTLLARIESFGSDRSADLYTIARRGSF